MLRNRIPVLILTCVLAACASTSHDVAPIEVPTTTYDSLACKDLASERARVNAEISQLADKIDGGLMAERIKMGVGVTLFWPALMFIESASAEHEELAQLKGERKSLRLSMAVRGCPIPPLPDKQARSGWHQADRAMWQPRN